MLMFLPHNSSFIILLKKFATHKGIGRDLSKAIDTTTIKYGLISFILSDMQLLEIL